MAGGAQQSATPSQGGQSGQMGQGGFGNQVSSLLQNPNLPSMLQNLNTSGISPQNQQAIQQAYQNAQHPMMSAPPQFSAQPQMPPRVGGNIVSPIQPQQFNAAIGMTSPDGSVVGPGQQGFQIPQGGGSFGMASSPTQNTQAIGRVLPNGSVVGPGQPGFDMPPGGDQAGIQMPPRVGGNIVSPTVQNTGGPDVTGNVPGGNLGFDQSGSDAGVGGQAVTGVQSPLSGGQNGPFAGLIPNNRPPMMSDFRRNKGFQIQGNPTAQGVQRGIGALGRRMR